VATRSKSPRTVRKGESVLDAAKRQRPSDRPPSLKDSGQRQEFSTGARRDTDENKPRYSLVPPRVLKRVVMIFTLGAIKYGDHNYQKGMPYSRYLDSAGRHIEQFRDGEEDEDHLAQACWNLMAIMFHQEYGPEGLDDVTPLWNPETGDGA